MNSEVRKFLEIPLEPDQPKGTSVTYYLSLAARRRWFIIIPFCVAMIVGSIVALVLPLQYEASTLILIQPQRVPERLVSPVTSIDIESRISTISQQILSRRNLEQLINKFNLLPGTMLMEEKIADLRSRIRVNAIRAGHRSYTEAFSIRFLDADPSTTMKVANGLATFFIDENLRVREDEAIGTTVFLETELAAMRNRLEEKERGLKEYRQRNMGELPDQLQANLNLLDRLNAQLGQSQLSLRSAQVSLVALEAEERTKQSVHTTISERAIEDSMNLPQLKDRLSTLRSIYTDNHPDIIRLKERVEHLKASKRSIDRPDTASQRVLMRGTIRSLETEIERINQEIREVQNRVNNIPEREQELMLLSRDYENIKASYRSLLDRKLEADISLNMEKRQKGQQFQVFDSARMPEKPVSPNMKRFFFFTIAACLGIGCGTVVLIDLMENSIHKFDQIEKWFAVTLLGKIPANLMRWRAEISVITALSLTLNLAIICFFRTAA